MGNVKFVSRLKDFACVPYVKENKWDGENWILLSELVVRLSNGRNELIPAGFITNFGSIPKPCRSFLNRMGKSLRAFVVHDWFYSKGEGDYKQRECDRILYDLSRLDGESWFDAQMINKGLAVGGWACYKKSEARKETVSKKPISQT